MSTRVFVLLVCSGRDYANRRAVFAKLDAEKAVVEERGWSLHIVQGGAEGADAFAREWAQSRCVPMTTYPANWNRDGKAAGPIRNQQMIETEPDAVLAFPGGRGTADMVRRARLHEVPVQDLAASFAKRAVPASPSANSSTPGEPVET